jgi:endonuclease YncB( thermonuclease family)
MQRLALVTVVLVAIVVATALVRSHARRQRIPPGWFAVDHVADGDTIVLRGGATVRLVQIDTPEVFFEAECYGKEASEATKHLLPKGALVRLERDPATDDTDAFARLLRYVVDARGRNVNLELVAEGAAAPYFFDGVRGAYGDLLLRAAEAARREQRGLWGACPGTEASFDEGVSTGPP